MTSRCVKHIYTLPQKLSSVIKKIGPGLIWKNKYDLTLCQTHLHTASKTFIRHKKKLDQVWFSQMNPQNIVLCPQTNSAFLKEAEGFLFQSFWYISVLRAARDGLEIVVSVEKRVRKGKRGSSFSAYFKFCPHNAL